MMQHDLIDKVLDFTRDKTLFSAPCHLLLGLSGGADSMALLHILLHWPVPGVKVSAVHIHHGLRGEAADRDEDFVRDYCVSHNVPLTIVHTDVASVAQEEHLSIETAGRLVRYWIFETVRKEVCADYIMTAHTASDQAETVLMHIIRGCGTDGLSGIPATRGNIRRPLLCCNRQEIESYCRENGIPYVTDETNFDVNYHRNDIRHSVLPLLREMNPAVDDALLRLSDAADADSRFLNKQAATVLQRAKRVYGYEVAPFLDQNAVIRRRMIRQIFASESVPTIEECHILAAEQALLSESGGVSLPGGFQWNVGQGLASISTQNAPGCLPVHFDCDHLPNTCDFSGYVVAFRKASGNVHKLLANSAMDCDKIKGELTLRTRRAGDTLHPSGRGVGKSLKKLMNEWKIPAHLRDGYPVLCDEEGVVFVPGFACDERVKISENTNDYIECRVEIVQG